MKYTVDIIRRDEAGLQFYLESYKPFRLLALQLSPEGEFSPFNMHPEPGQTKST